MEQQLYKIYENLFGKYHEDDRLFKDQTSNNKED